MNTILIKPYAEADAPLLAAIFFNTIHNINIKDYSLEQVNAWAPKLEPAGWIKKWEKLQPIVATIDNVVVGFAELEDNGHIDCFYCHHEYQRCGVGTCLMNFIENKARKNNISRLFAEVSITARAFFEARGFVVVKEQTVEIRGVTLTNFVMVKMLG